MIRRWFIGVVCILLTSCGKKNNMPKDIISPAKMQLVFWDMLRADILAEEIVKKDSTKNIKFESRRLNEQLYQVHHISESDFKKSIAFYEQRPELLRTIFDSLNAIQTRKNSSKPGYLKDHHPVNTFPFDKNPR